MQISQINNEIYNKFEFFEGSLPGNRIKSLSDTRFLMKQKNLQIMVQRLELLSQVETVVLMQLHLTLTQ